MECLEEEQAAFIGPRFEYYKKKWLNLEQSGFRKPGFNFASFFFSSGWFLYRRMYRLFWIATAAMVGVSVLAEFAAVALFGLETTSRAFDSLLQFAFSATCGTFGNYWYYRYTERKLAELRGAGSTSDQIRDAGGVRWGAPLLLTALMVVGMVARAYASP
jgi:hypothetical protein